MPKNCEYCKQCGLLITDDDREDGFCSDGCQEVYDAIKELDERFLRQEDCNRAG